MFKNLRMILIIVIFAAIYLLPTFFDELKKVSFSFLRDNFWFFTKFKKIRDLFFREIIWWAGSNPLLISFTIIRMPHLQFQSWTNLVEYQWLAHLDRASKRPLKTAWSWHFSLDLARPQPRSRCWAENQWTSHWSRDHLFFSGFPTHSRTMVIS